MRAPVFVCKKCEHHLFIESEIMGVLDRLNQYDCPNCGEDGELNWIFSHVGDPEEEEDNYNWK
ncbi:hypothetical protein [Halobacillus litoralis]|uniref:hypothetical protein n=1 Tax=Halobacillus litoralis TaxID=45668 RepID=UPI001CD293B6|nr:hypothetical protein [Halobacillus litoralis]MCA1021569.1 hypothetical protein [Halobacillus litoralis]